MKPLPEKIWLLPGCGADGETIWCDDPAPGLDMDPRDAVGYVRADVSHLRSVEALRNMGMHDTALMLEAALAGDGERRCSCVPAHFPDPHCRAHGVVGRRQ